MDTLLDSPEISVDTLSYDDNVPYSELPPPSSVAGQSLANRIGTTKVYLLSDTLGARVGKRKYDDDEERSADEATEDVAMGEGSLAYRENAILFHGTPISHLPTSNLFAYATHFDAHPMALEWIDDTTCVMVFPSKSSARLAHRHLAKSIAEEPSTGDGSVTAKPIPIAFWPPEERISKSLGKGEGLKGAIRMRWATNQDVKKRGARQESAFYKKHGNGGKDDVDKLEDGAGRKRRRTGELGEAVLKAELDDELDAFLAGDDATAAPPPSPPSKMRSDYIAPDGRTLLERTSLLRAHPDTLASRITADLPTRARSRRSGRRQDGGSSEHPRERRSEEHPSGRTGGEKRPRKTQEDLDAELDAFLNSRD